MEPQREREENSASLKTPAPMEWENGHGKEEDSGNQTDQGTSRGQKRTGEHASPPAKRPRKTPTPRLPYDVLLTVFHYLDVEDKQRAAQVCHLWWEAAYHWSLWRDVHIKVDIQRLSPSAYPSLEWRGLHRLTIRNLRSVDTFHGFVSSFSSLHSLKVSSTGLTGDDVRSVLSRPLPQLEVLHVCGLKDVGSTLGRSLPQDLSNVRSLQLMTSRPRQVRVLAEELPLLPMLRELCLDGMMLEDADVAALCERCPNLQYASLTLAHGATEAALRSLRGLPGLKKFSLEVELFTMSIPIDNFKVHWSDTRYPAPGVVRIRWDYVKCD